MVVVLVSVFLATRDACLHWGSARLTASLLINHAIDEAGQLIRKH